MRTFLNFTLPVATALVFAISVDAATLPALYERIAVRMSARKDLAGLGQPPVELKQVDWMLGQWSIETAVLAPTAGTAQREPGSSTITRALDGCWLQLADTYPQGNQGLGFLTYSPVTRRWVSIGLDTYGNAVETTAESWVGNKLELEADVEIMGEKAHLRQTVERLGPDEFLVGNAERLADGSWVKLDEYRYRRKQLNTPPETPPAAGRAP